MNKIYESTVQETIRQHRNRNQYFKKRVIMLMLDSCSNKHNGISIGYKVVRVRIVCRFWNGGQTNKGDNASGNTPLEDTFNMLS